MTWRRDLRPKQVKPVRQGTAILDGLSVPVGSDVAVRSELWREAVLGGERSGIGSGTRIGTETTVFHEGPAEAVGLKQDLDARRVTVTLAAPMGPFVSLAIDLPRSLTRDLGPRHIVRVETSIDAPTVPSAHVRLNLKNGGNTDRLTLDLAGRGVSQLDFDLVLTDLDDTPVSGGWIDILFSYPAPGVIAITDLVLSRRRRARF